MNYSRKIYTLLNQVLEGDNPAICSKDAFKKGYASIAIEFFSVKGYPYQNLDFGVISQLDNNISVRMAAFFVILEQNIHQNWDVCFAIFPMAKNFMLQAEIESSVRKDTLWILTNSLGRFAYACKENDSLSLYFSLFTDKFANYDEMASQCLSVAKILLVTKQITKRNYLAVEKEVQSFQTRFYNMKYAHRQFFAKKIS